MSRAACAASAPDQVDRRGEIDVDVVPLGRLGRRGEHRLGQAVGQLEAGRHGRPVHGARLLVLLVGLAGQIAAHDALELAASRPAAPAGPVRPTRRGSAMPRQGGLDLRGVGGQQGAGHDVGHLVAPEDGHGGEHPALVGDRLGHDHVEGADPVRGHHEQAVVAGVVELAHLARVDCGQGDASRRLITPAAASASAKRSVCRRVRVRSKASSSCASVRVTSGSPARTSRKGRRSDQAGRASRWTMR